MIDQLNRNINKPSVYAPFQTSGVNYSIYTPITKEEVKENEGRKTKTLGYSIAATAILLSFCTIALLKGLPKGARIRFDKLFRHIDEKIERITEKNQQASRLQKTYIKTLKGAKSILSKARAIYNIGPLKDVGVKVQARKFPIINKFFDTITSFYEKISVKKAKKSYSRTRDRIDDMFAYFARVNKDITPQKLNEQVKIGESTKTVKQWLEEIKQRHLHIITSYDTAFSATAQEQRLAKVKDSISDLDIRVYKSLYSKDIFKHKDNYQTFISEEYAAPAKHKAEEEVNALKRVISNNIDDNCTEINSIISRLEYSLDLTDRTQRILIRELRNSLHDYSFINGENEEAQRVIMTDKMSKTLDALNAHITQSDRYNDNITQKSSEYIRNLVDIIKSRPKGDIQEILTIYKHILSKEDYLKLKAVSTKTTKAINNSVLTETDKLFDKLRDFQVGSAILDTFSFLIALGSVGWGLGKADNKDEKISAGLRYGVPAIGGIATVLYCTTRLISGGAAILTGLLSGIAIGKVGDYIDEKRKELNKHPLTLNKIASSGLSLINPD